MDMAIGLVIFNPAKTKRIIMNYLYTVNEFRRHGFPVFTMELCFGNSKPEIPDSIVVRGNSYMFHKERLCRLLERKIPNTFKKIVFVDADILFDSPDWYTRTSDLLETHDVIQPFETCNWIDLTYRKVMQTKKTVLLMKCPGWDWSYHPGFAWAFRREWYNSVGFFDLVVTGSGDTYSADAWLGIKNSYVYSAGVKSLEPAFKEFHKLPRPRISYVPNITVTHLYHGSAPNRKYGDRKFLYVNDNDIRECLYENSDGVYEWKSPLELNPKYIQYFKERFDDDLSA